jgi:hypothetical protein
VTTAEARTRKLTGESEFVDLKLAERRGELVDRQRAEAAMFARARCERDCWNGRAARAAAALAAKLGVDSALVLGALDALVRGQLGRAPP